MWLAVFALTGCSRPPGPARAASGDGYAPPPTVQTATRAADGAVKLTGRSSGGALLRLRSPDGEQATARASADGGWALDLPPSELPRLYAFEAVTAGKLVRSEGALAVMPDPGPVALVLRAGFAARTIGPAPQGRLSLISLDYDGNGAAAGGFAPAHSRIRLAVDDVVLGEAEADAQGRFSILAVDPGHGVAPGVHAVKLYTPQGLEVDRTVDTDAQAIPPDRAFASARTSDGWTVSWRLPGGGVQNSQVFNAAVSASLPPAPPLGRGR